MSENSKKIVALILAAGESSRLGQAKQNLRYKNRTLLNHSKERLSLNNVERTFIVLGAYAQEIKEKCKLTDAEVIEFDGWKEGMGSSLAYACSKIFAENNFDGILITLSDLTLVEKADYLKMIEKFDSHADIVATKAINSLGVPAIFGAHYFNELLQVKGEKGAKPLIEKYKDIVKVYVNDKATVDIDTLENYLKLVKGS